MYSLPSSALSVLSTAPEVGGGGGGVDASGHGHGYGSGDGGMSPEIKAENRYGGGHGHKSKHQQSHGHKHNTRHDHPPTSEKDAEPKPETKAKTKTKIKLPASKPLKQFAFSYGTVVGTAYFRNASKDPQRRMRIILGNPERVRGTREVEMRDVRKWMGGEYSVFMSGRLGEGTGFFENEFPGGRDNGWASGWSKDELNARSQNRDQITRSRAKEIDLDSWDSLDANDPTFRAEKDTRLSHRGIATKTDADFCWRRTHSTPAGLTDPALNPSSLKRILSAANFKLVDDKGGIVAVFENNGLKSSKKVGKVMILDGGDGGGDWGEHATGLDKTAGHGFGHGNRNVDKHGKMQMDTGTGVHEVGLREVFILLSYCVIEEKMRRGS